MSPKNQNNNSDNKNYNFDNMKRSNHSIIFGNKFNRDVNINRMNSGIMKWEEVFK